MTTCRLGMSNTKPTIGEHGKIANTTKTTIEGEVVIGMISEQEGEGAVGDLRLGAGSGITGMRGKIRSIPIDTSRKHSSLIPGRASWG